MKRLSYKHENTPEPNFEHLQFNPQYDQFVPIMEEASSGFDKQTIMHSELSAQQLVDEMHEHQNIEEHHSLLALPHEQKINEIENEVRRKKNLRKYL